MEITWIVQTLLVPLLLLIGGKWLDNKMEKHRNEQDAILHSQLDDLAKKQQREADRDTRIEILSEGLQAILRDRILQSTDYFIRHGSITRLALENIERMHTAYKSLGGNGLCDRSFEVACSLPIDRFVDEDNDK